MIVELKSNNLYSDFRIGGFDNTLGSTEDEILFRLILDPYHDLSDSFRNFAGFESN